MHPAILQPHGLMDHRYNSLPFSIQNSNSYSFMSQTFMLQGSHTSPPPMMLWARSPAAGQPPTWLPPPPLAGYWLPPPSGRYWPPPPPRPSKPEFQHSSPTFRPGILAAAAVGTSSSRASPAVGNASVDNTDAAAVATFFFTTYDMSFVPTLNCSIRNTSKYRMSRLLVHLCLQASFFICRT
jgi:hypothetical protein